MQSGWRRKEENKRLAPVDANAAASWVQAVATCAALGAAGYAALTTRRLYGLDHERSKREVAEQQRRFAAEVKERASGIAVWWCRRVQDQRYGLLLSNRTDGVVHNLKVKTRISGATADAEWLFLPPGDLFAPKPLGSSESRGFEFPEPLTAASDYKPVMSTGKFQIVSVRFTDDAGNAWVRQLGGRLEADGATDT